jgi:hypothetical protein
MNRLTRDAKIRLGLLLLAALGIGGSMIVSISVAKYLDFGVSQFDLFGWLGAGWLFYIRWLGKKWL